MNAMYGKKKNQIRFFTGPSTLSDFGTFYHSWAHHIYCEKIQQQIDGYDEKYRESWDGKIMGLSAYGANTEFTDNDKEYKLSKDLAHGTVPYVAFNLTSPPKWHTFKNVDEKAYLLQKNFESALFEYFTELKNESYLDDYVCLSGGSFLNVLGNTVLKKSGIVKDIHVPPCPNDTGLHFGAACYGVFKSGEEVKMPENIALLGKEYSDEEIEEVLKESGVSYEKYDNFDELCDLTSLYLSANKIIGWFQGRSEFGPRALGSRSLLMHPGPERNKDTMNHRVKHREYWRPFAGIILEENLNEYFEEDFDTPYMLYALTVKEDQKYKLGAITHEDNTCRIQTVNDRINPKMTQLLKKFEEYSGVPIVLNTSFNDNGEPIVESPQDAIRSFNNMDIDYLVIGNYVVRK